MNNNKISIAKKKIGDGEPVYIISEIGSNHNQNLELALEMIERSAEAGADAVKFQAIKFDELYSIKNENKQFYNWFKKIELEESWLPILSAKAKSYELDFLCTPTYCDSIKLLCDLKVPALKIASPQVQANHVLLKQAAETKKTLLLSLGYSDYSDIFKAQIICSQAGNENLIFLHCISSYPANPKDMQLKFIRTIRKMTNKPVGFSDHSLGTTMSVAAVTLGAAVIEKHVTTDKKHSGPDHAFAMEFKEFKSFIDQIKETELALGDGTRQNFLEEEIKLRHNVTLYMYSVENIKKGEKFHSNNIKFLRYGDLRCFSKENVKLIKFEQYQCINSLMARKNILKNHFIEWKDVYII